MDIDLASGRYVVAVSGGVDSMALLELLRRKPGIELVVAHFDHGIREDSSEDRKLIQDVAKKHGLQFVYDEGRLGAGTSEAVARKARYDFLHRVREASGSVGLITAHHQNDVIETAILNMIRGTGRNGLSSLKSADNIYRPLLHLTKPELINFAQSNDIPWREDSTNQDVKYLRNYVRHKIIPRLSDEDRKKFLSIINKTKKLNETIQEQLVSLLHVQPAIDRLDRHWFIMLPHPVATEVMAEWLKRHSVKDVSKKMITKLVTIAKTSQPHRVADVDKNYILKISPKDLTLVSRG